MRRPSRHVLITIVHQMGFESPLSPQLRQYRSIISYLHPVLGIQLLGSTADPGPAHRQLYVPTRFSDLQFVEKITPNRPWSLSSVAGLSVYVAGRRCRHLPTSTLSHTYCYGTYGLTSQSLPGSREI